jgi:hypothetical protein
LASSSLTLTPRELPPPSSTQEDDNGIYAKALVMCAFGPQEHLHFERETRSEKGNYGTV